MGIRSSKQKADITTPPKDKKLKRKKSKRDANGGIEEVAIQEKKDETELITEDQTKSNDAKVGDEPLKKSETGSNAPTEIVEDSPDKETEKVAQLSDVLSPTEPSATPIEDTKASAQEVTVAKVETVDIVKSDIPEQKLEEPAAIPITEEKSESKTEPAATPSPIVETKAEPVLESKPEPAVEAVSEPVVEATPEPVVEAAPEPVVEAAPEPVVEVAPEPVVEVAPEPVVEAAPEPVVEAAPEPVVEAAPEPVVEAAPEPVVEATPEPVVEAILEPVVEAASAPVVEAVPVLESAPEPVVEVTPEPVVDATPDTLAETIPSPVVESLPEPVVDVIPEPVVETAPVTEAMPEPIQAAAEPVVEAVPEPIAEAVPEPVEQLITVQEPITEAPLAETLATGSPTEPEAPAEVIPESIVELESPVEIKSDIAAESSPEVLQTTEPPVAEKVLEENESNVQSLDRLDDPAVVAIAQSPTTETVEHLQNGQSELVNNVQNSHEEISEESPKVPNGPSTNGEQIANGEIMQNGTNEETTNGPTEGATLISWKHGGDEVAVCGDFSKWADNCLLSKTDGIFSTKIKLAKGENYIKFLVDGKWTVDENEPIVELEGHGQVNLVVVKCD